MSEPIVQWLAEIRDLKQKLAEAQQERDLAYENEANWRKLYAAEAQQRRIEVKLAQERVEQLQLEISELKFQDRIKFADQGEVISDLEAELAELDSLESYKRKLIEVIQERDRFAKVLKMEQENHLQTRESLTAVIGETIDQLAKERQGNNNRE
jgi:hypothetical protein